MGKIFKIKPVINKANGQINFSLSRKNLPVDLKKMIKSGNIPILKLRFEGVDK